MFVDTDSDIKTDAGTGEVELTKKELEEFMLMAKQKAIFNAQARNFNEICWDICVEKPGTKLDQKTSLCLSNCVDRFIDSTLFIANRYAQMLQRGGARMS